MIKPELHYKKEQDYYLIEIKLNEIRQLFNSFDPAPFREKDLEASAEEYIVDSIRDLRMNSPVKLVLYLPQQSCTEDQRHTVPDAIHHYFSYRSTVTEKELRFTMQQGRIALLIGLVFLFLCITAQHFIAALGKTDLLWLIIQEGFLISGWVAMWKPLDVFLYEWWPIQHRRRIYEKLMQIPVEIREY